jgi:hypothetical protein
MPVYPGAPPNRIRTSNRLVNPHFSHWIGESGKVGLKAASGSDFLT